MASTGADLESGVTFVPMEVRCHRGTGTIMMTQSGDFVFKPHPPRGGLFSWIVNLLRPLNPQHIPADQLLGAKLESPCAFTVWYAYEYTSTTGVVRKQRFRACSTQRFETPDTAAAAGLVDHLRRASSWWGRVHPPHIAAVVNPVSGRGAAVRMFESRLLPLLRDVAGMRVTIHVTNARMHAADLVRDMPLRPAGRCLSPTMSAIACPAAAESSSSTPAAPAAVAGPGLGGGGGDQSQGSDEEAAGVDLIMFVGGDGTLYEGLQGLFQRPDWDTARHVPLAAVPCGSGNGLAASTGLWDPITAAVAVCRGRLHPVDVASVLQPPGNRFYCLLSVVYGGMANLDIGTNHLRWMGELRFHLGGLRELIRGRCYNCRVFVLPPEGQTETVDGAVAAAAAPSAPECSGGSSASLGRKAAAAAAEGIAAGAAGLGPVLRSVATCAIGSGDRDGGSGMEERLLPGGVSSLGVNVPCPDVASGAGLRLSDYPEGPALPLLSQLPSLPSPLPDSPTALPPGWVQLADSFAIFGAYNTQYLALGARSNPGGRMADGAWEVWHLEADGQRAGYGIRTRSLKVLLGVEDGSFAATPGVMSVTKARALMFEQRDSSTWTVLDGEEVPDLPLYLEVHPGLCSMLVAPGFKEEGL